MGFRICAQPRFVAVLIGFLTLPFVLTAQSNEGIIAGTVLDQSGATVEGAKVEAKNDATGGRFNATSSPSGAFRFPALQVGSYDLKVSRDGFQTTTQKGVGVQINNTSAVTITLKVGDAATSVTVQADVTRIATESSDIGTVISSKQVIELPLALGGVGALRSPEAFAFLAPGTTGPGTASSNNGVFISKLGGGQNFGNEVLLDGASILRTENGSSFDEAAPSVEAIGEFKVLTSTFPAIYGRTTGGIESFTTKSGTNSFHGTAYDIFRNDALDANTWLNNGFLARCAPGDQTCRAPYERPIDKKNDYGVNLGGPVWVPKLYDGRNKTFFFFNWEQYQQNLGGTHTSIVPTPAERGGDFSADQTGEIVGQNCDGSSVFRGQIFDPATTRTVNGINCRTPFAGNIIPQSRFSPVSNGFLQYYPLPNASVPGERTNYALSTSTPLYNTTYTIRIDHNFSEKSHLFATYDTRENARYAGSGFNILPAPVDPDGWNQDFITHYGRFGWDYIFSPTLLNHLNGGWNRTNSQNYTAGAVQARSENFNWAQRVGINGLVGTNFPVINVGEGIPNLSSAHNDTNVDNGIRVNDYVTWALGKHNLTIGFDFRNQLYSTYAFDTDTGSYNFSRAQTAATRDLNATSGNGFASFLLGDVSEGSAFIVGHVARWTAQYYGGFVQDDFKVLPNLTLNLGIRYDVDVPRKESKDLTSNFSRSLANPGAAGQPGALEFGSTCQPGCNPRWADTYYKDVAPRVGFAWTPNGLGNRLVLRGGYGIYYSPLQYTDFGGAQVQGYSATPDFLNNDNFSAGFNWSGGFPAHQNPPILDPSYLNGQHPQYIDSSYGRPGLIQSWSFQLQGQVSKDTVATLGYVGQRSTHLRSQLQNINNIAISSFGLGSALTQDIASNTVGVASPYAGFNGQVSQALRPYPQFGYITADALQNIGQSSYHSLQASLERRFSSGLSLQASFTWSKILTDADSILPGINGGVQQIQNVEDLRQEKALSSQDVPYTFTTAPLYELPFGKGKPFLKSGVAGAILGGWQIGAVLRYQKGIPISFGCAQGIPGYDNCIRFNRNGLSPFSQEVSNGTFDPFVNNYFNRAAFNDPNATRNGGTYQFGNYPRNNGDARSPNYYNEDFAVIRNFHIFESITLQAKGEMLNAFNRHIFNVPDANPNDANFGSITALANPTIDAPRAVQFTLRVNF